MSPADRPLAVEPEPVERTAARWFARRRSGEMTDAETRELQLWLDADPAHRFTYDTIARAWARTGLMRTTPEVLQLRARHRRPFPRARRLLASRAIAASLAAAVIGVAGLTGVRAGLTEMKRLPDAAYSTKVGEQRTITLKDGTVVTLNTDSVLRTERSRERRLIYLDKGQAYFRVAHDPAHPFVVNAGGRTVTALGTAFDVRVDDGRFEVVLVEGRVKVETPVAPAAHPADTPQPRPQATELAPGSRLVAVTDRDWRVGKADVLEDTAWVTGWLTFDAEPLGEVVAELGRYTPRRIVLADPTLSAAPISGRFKPGDIDAFLRALETYDIAKVSSRTPTEIRLISANEKITGGSMGG